MPTLNNYEQLRTKLFSSPTAIASEKIEVNQRHLIDKILARYSAEFTIYREVLQNANDASASSLEIIFQCEDKSNFKSNEPAVSDVNKETSALVNGLVLRNNGRPFTENDWKRLQKIAEGNPDESKIGFFGVGFYSLFSICEEPFVVSSKKCLAFYWNGDQLYARPGETSAEVKDEWTSIYLNLREPLLIPNLDQFAHFIAKSILFTDSLCNVSTFKNEELLFKVTKKRASATSLPFDMKSVLPSAVSKPNAIFKIKDVTMQSVQLDLDKRYESAKTASTKKGLLSSIWSMAKEFSKDRAVKVIEERVRSPGKFSLFLRLINGDIQVNSSSAFNHAMERITKKNPPSQLKISLIYSSFDELQASSISASEETMHVAHPVLQGLLPERDSGRVFIGFETHQSTGLAIHMAAPFIPTVERESLDFVDKTLAAWNSELLRVCGKLSRIVYETEVGGLSKMFPPTEGLSLLDDRGYADRAVHILKSFGINESTPSALVAPLLEEELFDLAFKYQTFQVPSTIGVLSFTSLRNVPVEILPFTVHIPSFISDSSCDLFIASYKRHFTVKPVDFIDVMNSLNGKQLNNEQLVACLSWIISEDRKERLSVAAFHALQSSLLMPINGFEDKWEPIAKMTHFPGSDFLDNTFKGLLPPFCIAPWIAKKIPVANLRNTFNLKQLSIVDWIVFQLKQNCTDTLKIEEFLIFIEDFYKSCGEVERAEICSLLSEAYIIPTATDKLVRPREAFLEEVKLFGQMNTVKFKKRHLISSEFLIALGVQSHLEVKQIFANFTKMNWDHRQLVKYLARFEADLSKDEMDLLRSSRIFPAIDRPVTEKYILSELYMEDPLIKYLNLPILSWKHGKAPSAISDSTYFMKNLGLNSVAPWEALLRSVGSAPSVEQRTLIFRYFIDNYNKEYRGKCKPESIDFDYLPLQNDPSRLALSNSCYLDKELRLLGFDTLHSELHSYAHIFRVTERPPSKLLIESIASKRFADKDASAVFTYLSRCCNNFTSKQWNLLSESYFIPVHGSHYRPIDLFFSKGQFDFGEAFHVIDFGHGARQFLKACGVQDEPQAGHIVQRLSLDASKIFNSIGCDAYLGLLHWISLQFDQLTSASVKALKSEPILLGLEYVIGEGDEELMTSRYLLSSAAELYIIDDSISQQIFKCCAVPAEPLLEQFYRKLGSRALSTCVKTTWKYNNRNPSVTTQSSSLEKLIKSRAPLLVSVASASKVSRNALAKLRSVEVAVVPSITLIREFNGLQKDQSTSACYDRSTLYITEPFEYYDVATAISGLIYVEGRLSDCLLVANLLSSTLSSLRSKGFPVDRLLHEQSLKNSANSEVKNKTIAIETSSSIEGNKKIVNSEEKTIKSTVPEDERTENYDKAEKSDRKSLFERQLTESRTSGIFSTIKGALAALNIRKSPGPQDQSNSNFASEPQKLETTKVSSAMEPHHNQAIKDSLSSGIKMLKSTTESNIQNSPQQLVEPPQSIQAECSSYCQVIPGHNLRLWKPINGIAIYISNHQASHEFSADRLAEFASILKNICAIFKADISTVNVFIDDNSTAIAFNRDRCLFFNFMHYLGQVSQGTGLPQIIVSWYLTACHELAHNFIRNHDERHEFYMSSYAEFYFDELIKHLS